MSSCLRTIARVHPVHSMNADSAPTSDQAKQLGLWVLRYAATVHIHHRYFIITQPEVQIEEIK